MLLMNAVNSKQQLEFKLADVPDVKGPCSVRDLWEHKDLGVITDSMTFSVATHDAAFLRLDCGSKMVGAIV